MRVDRYKTHDIELIVDRLRVKQEENDLKRLVDFYQNSHALWRGVHCFDGCRYRYDSLFQ